MYHLARSEPERMKMLKWIVRFFGLKGSWKWACRQMDKGRIVFRISDTGCAKYKLDPERQRRIIWTHQFEPSDWHNAYIFLGDFEATDWVIYDVSLYAKSYRQRWSNYGYKGCWWLGLINE